MKALLGLSIAHDISETEFLFLGKLKCALEPIKLAVEALRRQDATLLTAEGIIRFLFAELKNLESALAKDLLCAIKTRMQQRRHHDLVNLLRYLKNPNTVTEHDDDFPSSNITKQGLPTTATTLISRLFGDNGVNEAEGQTQEQIELENNNARNDSRFERLQAHIEDFTEIQPSMSSHDNGSRTIIKQEMKLLEATGKQPSQRPSSQNTVFQQVMENIIIILRITAIHPLTKPFFGSVLEHQPPSYSRPLPSNNLTTSCILANMSDSCILFIGSIERTLMRINNFNGHKGFCQPNTGITNNQ